MDKIMNISELKRRLVACVADRSGAVLVEMALVFPFLLLLGLGGLELVNMTMTQTRLNQLALAAADNASRIAVANGLSLPKVREVDVNELFIGTKLQSGSVDIENRGRVILSSLENKPGGTLQRIQWQRCFGKLDVNSSYGLEGDGRNDNSVTGMGPADNRIRAVGDAAVMFVEIFYDYEPLFYTALFEARRMHSTAAFNIREGRDLSKIYNDAPAVDPLECD